MKCLNFEVDVIDFEWGEGVDLDIFKKKLYVDYIYEVKVVCVVYNEMVMGVMINFSVVC